MFRVPGSLPFVSEAGRPGIRERWWPTHPPVLSPATPLTAAAWQESHPELPWPVWTRPSFASCLAHALPERKVWIDTRLELYPVEQWERYRDATAVVFSKDCPQAH